MGKLIKRGNTWHAHYHVFHPDGSTELKRESTKCSDRRAAEQWLAKAERDSTSPHRKKERWLVSDLCDWYLETATFKSEDTAKMRSQKLANVTRLLGIKDTHTLSKKDVREYIAERLNEDVPRTKRKVTPHTVVKEIVSLSQALKLASDMDKWDGDVRMVIPRLAPEYDPRDTWLDPDQYRRMHNELQNDRDRLWCDIAVYTMGRYKEVSNLDWADFNWPRSVNLRGTKTKKSNRWIPLHPALVSILEPHRKESGLVVGKWRNCYRALRVACKRAGVPRITCNDLRRSGISLMIQQGANRNAVADIAGHTDTKMIDRVYAQMNMKTKEEAIATLPSMDTAPKREQVTVTNGSRWGLVEID